MSHASTIPDRRYFKSPADWDVLRARFRWQLPEHFNIGVACCDSWAMAAPDRVALIHVEANGEETQFTYNALRTNSNRLANAMAARGLGRGDRCAILLAQSPEAMLAHLANFKLGAISLPLFTLFGEDGLEYRLKDSGAKVVVTDRANLAKVLNIKDKLPDLEVIYSIDGPEAGALGFWQDVERASSAFTPVATTPDDPALICYTSGTTGPPKGALHGHRFLLGHIPCVELFNDFFPRKGDKGWTPADWAWIGGLMNVALPNLYLGVPLVSHRMAKFDPDAAYDLIGRQGIRNMFLPPTALKLMRQASVPAHVAIRSIGSGGESLGADMAEWGRSALGITINEIYGQTECNLVLTSSSTVLRPKPGAIGRAVPGHRVAVIDSQGNEAPTGELGEIAVARPDPVMFLRYWNLPEKTAEKFVGDWLRTGDLGVMDEEGYFTFASRDDDVITSSGYRIGPTEIENCLTGHPDVVMAAAIGVPDPVRTEIVKAFVVLREGATWEGLEAALIARVRKRVSPHVAPRMIEQIAAMPMTATGKIVRRDLRGEG